MPDRLSRKKGKEIQSIRGRTKDKCLSFALKLLLCDSLSKVKPVMAHLQQLAVHGLNCIWLLPSLKPNICSCLKYSFVLEIK